MKKLISSLLIALTFTASASAYQLLSSKELGQGDAKNQTVVVRCTTDTGKTSTQTCTLRRYVKCSGTGTNKRCSGWQAWQDLRTPAKKYSDWRSAASACCRAKGLR